MDNEQKERLGQELRFLEESLEADVISREEYLKGKERIEKKLKELEEKEEISEEKKPEEVKEEISEEKISVEEEKETKLEEEKQIEEVEEREEEKKEEIKEEPEEKVEKEEIKEKKEAVKEEKLSEEKEEEIKKEEIKEKEEAEEEVSEEKEKKPKRWLKWIFFLIVIVFLYFLFRGCGVTDKTPLTDNPEIMEIKPACISDEDCQKPGKLGFCINPNTTEAKCEFKEAVKVNLTIANDKNCRSCDTIRMTQVIKQLFPGAVEKEVHYNSQEGLSLLKKFDINVLPAYIFDNNIVEAANFNRFKNALTKKGDKYLITPIASGANYYFKRDEIKNKLDLFVIQGSDASLKAENNVKDVLELFDHKINFTKHIVSAAEKELLQSKLGIKSFPVFLVNNQLKFGGVRSPEAIKEKFCEFNELKECEEKLLESIK